MRTFSVLLLLLGVGVSIGEDPCEFQAKCGDCIQVPGCMWCSEFEGISKEERTTHCLKITDPKTTQCKPGASESPKNSHIISRDDPLSESARESTQKGIPIIQIKPQEIKMNLRKGVAETITLKYKQAYGYPIDLYYLMDLSKSMEDDKAQLARLGGLLTKTLHNLTELYTIGFGSFVDKVMMPFVDTHPQRINSPCPGCAKAYSFRNDLPLGSDGSLFAKGVTEAKISGNLDSPEGGFDALMQAIVCEDQIKWRAQARRIIVFSTDAQFHQAGDGKLAGVVIPNDEKCHLNANNEYDAYDKFDYPSVGQINKVTKERDIYVIFAVSGYDELYQELTKVIENSSYGKLNRNSDNVVTLVRDQYNAISSKISLSDNSSSAVSIEYYSKCKNKGGAAMKTNQCFDIKEYDVVDFELSVKLNECPVGRNSEIVEVKTLQDSLFLNIEFACDCNCEKEDDRTISSSSCDDHGAIVCGVCDCFQGFTGDKCQCALDGKGDDKLDEDLCRAPGETEICSGKGHCVCGTCQCIEEDFTGKYCHCNKRYCLSNEGDICSNFGTCSCQTCSCVPGRTGRVCECESDDACRMQGQREICSGHGTCDCGRCVCNSTAGEESYSGQYCEDCLSCIGGKCKEFYDDVLCRVRDPSSSSCNQTVIPIDSLEEQEERGARLCSFIDDEDDCMIFFTYRYLDLSKSYEIYVQREKQCPEPPPIMAIAFGILAGIVLIGLLTLLAWKLATSIHDRREFAKFQAMRDKEIWAPGENPLYETPLNTFANPTFSQQTAN